MVQGPAGFIAGFLVGVLMCLGLAPAEAKPTAPAVETHCVGNGKGGFRSCDLDFRSKDLNRIRVNILIDGEDYGEFNYWPQM